MTMGDAIQQFKTARSDPKFLKRSVQSKKNKRRGGDPEVEAERTHYGGSQSMHQRAMNVKKKIGEFPLLVQLFLDTKSKENETIGRTFATKKDLETWSSYLEATRAPENEGVDPSTIWFRGAEGYRKGGCTVRRTLIPCIGHHPIFGEGGHATSTECVPSEMVEMRSELREERAQQAAMAEKMKEQDERLKMQDERMKMQESVNLQILEELPRLRSMQQYNCNSSPILKSIINGTLNMGVNKVKLQ